MDIEFRVLPKFPTWAKLSFMIGDLDASCSISILNIVFVFLHALKQTFWQTSKLLERSRKNNDFAIWLQNQSKTLIASNCYLPLTQMSAFRDSWTPPDPCARTRWQQCFNRKGDLISSFTHWPRVCSDTRHTNGTMLDVVIGFIGSKMVKDGQTA